MGEGSVTEGQLLAIGLILDFQLVHVHMTGKALRLAHFPEKRMS